MIIGECPYCGETMANPMPDETPALMKIPSLCCDQVVWILCSRISSWAATEEEFLKAYEVDEETMSVTKR